MVTLHYGILYNKIFFTGILKSVRDADIRFEGGRTSMRKILHQAGFK